MQSFYYETYFSFICEQTNFQMKSFALSLAFIMRLKTARKCLVCVLLLFFFFFFFVLLFLRFMLCLVMVWFCSAQRKKLTQRSCLVIRYPLGFALFFQVTTSDKLFVIELDHFLQVSIGANAIFG